MEIDKVVFMPNPVGAAVHANKKGTVNVFFKEGVTLYYVSVYISSKNEMSLHYPRFYIRNAVSYPVVRLTKDIERAIMEKTREILSNEYPALCE